MSAEPRGERAAAPGDGAEAPLEVVARFAPGEPAEAPQGTVGERGAPQRPFHGWLELMAIVERLLERRGHRHDGG